MYWLENHRPKPRNKQHVCHGSELSAQFGWIQYLNVAITSSNAATTTNSRRSVSDVPCQRGYAGGPAPDARQASNQIALVHVESLVEPRSAPAH